MRSNKQTKNIVAGRKVASCRFDPFDKIVGE